MKPDAKVLQALVDRLEALQRGKIDFVDGGEHQNDVSHLAPVRHARLDQILQKARVDEVEALVDPQRQ
mgnify:CR=1 FL=1